MPNRNLNADECGVAAQMLLQIRERLTAAADGDPQLLFAYRRKIYKELVYDERGKPSHRKKLKQRKHLAQNGRCAECAKDIPVEYSELDRFEAWRGCTDENTCLICHACHVESQRAKKVLLGRSSSGVSFPVD